ncbi:uncharacterized protein LOC126824737 isoform X1 [Patella vulgata]|uniref:uncharacterized protein LOC126824737 isoform X1 n=1 Tax=Patella vulgata TaxID=6465 RepID=UPI0021801567|nr:uncharacterized protein LOC126824737 isoform X1 [Patella vulgata]
MDERYKAILDRHRQLLIKNIILTDEFYEMLQKERVLPDAMIKDVKEGSNQEEKNERLLNALLLRTSLTFRRFRDVLLKSGHHFLADLLWEEDLDTFTLDDNILQKFPNTFDKLTDDVKKKLVLFIDSKVREKALQITWRTTSIDRVTILRGRSLDFKNEKNLRENLDEQDKRLLHLKNEMCAKDERIRLLSIENQSIQREIDQLKYSHKKELEKQSNFNSANNSAILRLKEKFISFNESVIQMNQVVRNYLGDEPESYNTDPDNIKLSYLEKNLKRVLQNAKISQQIADNFMKEKQEVVKIFGKTTTKTSLKEIIEDYIDKEQKSKISLWRDIEKLADVIRGLPKTGILQKRVSNDSLATDFRFLKNYVATLRVEVEHLHKRMLWKDNQIRELSSDVESYKRQLPKIRISKTPPPSPESTYAMDVAYSRVDDYITSNSVNKPIETSIDGNNEFGLETYQTIPVHSSEFCLKNKKERHVVFSDLHKDTPSKKLSSTSYKYTDLATLPPV